MFIKYFYITKQTAINVNAVFSYFVRLKNNNDKHKLYYKLLSFDVKNNKIKYIFNDYELQGKF